MTDQSAQEPTMEEILASIRRIISEDDAPVEAAVEAAPEPEIAAEDPPAPVAEAVEAAPVVEEDVLELTEPYEAPAAESIGDLDVAEAAPFPTPEPEPAAVEPASEPAPSYDSLVGESGATVEAMVREMLRPMLKEWLDANLPTIVETQVRKEVERIARNVG
jgi:cell pole-organizing protein PopZ